MNSVIDAIICCPEEGVYLVKVMYRTADTGRRDRTMPCFEIPVGSYEQAKRVVDAINKG